MNYTIETTRCPKCAVVPSVRLHRIHAMDEWGIVQTLSLTTGRYSANIHVGWVSIPISRYQAAQTLREVRKEQRNERASQP